MSARLIPRSPFFHSLLHSSSTAAVRPEFLTSLSSHYVNPRRHILNSDCVTQVIPNPAISGINDERALALFTSGFFGGFVFALEWLLLMAGGGKILPVGYTGFPRSSQSAEAIWRYADLSDAHLHPIGTRILGSFMVLDRHIAPESDLIKTGQSTSWVDYGFGRDESSFAGCHRIQITRTAGNRGEVESTTDTAADCKVQIELQGLQCNPQKNEQFGWEVFKQFHYGYAKLLFANGIQAVLLRGS